MLMMQDPSTMMMTYMSMTHNLIMEVMIMVAMFILMLMIKLNKNKYNNRMTTQKNALEIIWTILPMIILIYMASPSLQLLYLLEENQSPSLTIKAMAHQWYWSYEYPDFKKLFDSYMINEKLPNKFRLLDTDNRVMAPFNIPTRILCTSSDVIHSWAMPSMGLKMDAIPGRINQMTMVPTTMGLFFGQCSEICGMNHSFMPIALEVMSVDMFITWIESIQ